MSLLSRPHRTDAATHCQMVITFDESMIHSGNSFVCRGYKDIASGGTYDLLIVTPDTSRLAHATFQLFNATEIEYYFYINTVTSDNGTQLSCLNRNNNSATTPTTMVYHTPTVTDVGDLAADNRFGNNRTFGGQAHSTEELILKRNTKYLIRTTNRTSGAANLFNYVLSWYEHENIS
jgi:hypothetical protein